MTDVTPYKLHYLPEGHDPTVIIILIIARSVTSNGSFTPPPSARVTLAGAVAVWLRCGDREAEVRVRVG